MCDGLDKHLHVSPFKSKVQKEASLLRQLFVTMTVQWYFITKKTLVLLLPTVLQTLYGLENETLSCMGTESLLH